MNRRQALAALILLVTVWLGACEKSDERSHSRSDPGTHTEAALFDAYPSTHDAGVDTSLAGNGFGTCVDDPQFLTECQAPVAELASSALSKPDVSETICAVAHHGSGSVGIEQPAAAQMTNAATPVQPAPMLAASTLSKRCNRADLSTELAPNADASTTGQAVGCSCGMKLCACG